MMARMASADGSYNLTPQAGDWGAERVKAIYSFYSISPVYCDGKHP
jgi:hypothetical protein